MASRVVRPIPVTLKISQGDWLLVKKRLNAGENREHYKRIVKAAPIGDVPDLESTSVGLSRALAYLLDWSLTDESGKVLPLRDKTGALSPDVMTASLDSIDPLSFGEIIKAIDAHEAKENDARENEKNAQDGENKSSAISPSPEPLVGATSGFQS